MSAARPLGSHPVTSPMVQRRGTALLAWWAGVRADALDAWMSPMVRKGSLGAMAITIGSFTPAFLPTDSHVLDVLGMPWMASLPWRIVATGLVLLGVALLLEAWLRLRPRSSSAPLPAVISALWSLPLLIAPPLFSRDAYSYAAQGHIVEMSWDPYSVGPFYSPGSFMDQVDPMWLFTPAPYGPLALQAQHLVVTATGGHAFLAAIGMRVWGLLAVALIAYALPRLAENVGMNRNHAVWLGVLNPLVILHLVGGAHNDAIMIALSCVALLLASQGRLAWAVVAVAAAAGFKQTGVLTLIGVTGLALQFRQPLGTSQRVYLTTLLRSGVAAFAVFAALTQLSGLGWGWVPNLSVPVSLRSMLSPPTFVGSVLEGVLTVLGVPEQWRTIPLHAMQGLGVVVAIAAIGYLTWRYGRTRPMVAVAGSFIALCLGSPVIHPWYTLWGMVLLGATRVRPRMVTMAVWVTVFLLGYSAMDAAVSSGLMAMGLTAVTIAVWRWRRALRSGSFTAADARTSKRLTDHPHTPLHLERPILRVQ
ncbi:MAG TPA: polyprenol phosphomannose-dependent alpha 1,6 mannosyltransferase MptB [Dermatophilaceae bacterium]|nr:polyprenol phosphomannose-dependent alpha 1,6 mannosyltransferase MptB [Dermatophilaceae bacterium]